MTLDDVIVHVMQFIIALVSVDGCSSFSRVSMQQCHMNYQLSIIYRGHKQMSKIVKEYNNTLEKWIDWTKM